jgi:poly(A) polymerase
VTGLPHHVQQLSLRVGDALGRIDPDAELFLVGGIVRDVLLGAQAGHDVDYATSAPPRQTERALSAAGGKVFNLGEKFGTIGAVFESSEARTIVEITTYRAEAYEPGSRKPSVAFGRSLANDLARRDFTINAMAQNPRGGELVDPFDGQSDLERGLVRAVGKPAERFREDPLRLLRAVRFASRLGFEIEPHTARAIVESASALATISRERVRDELEKTLLGPAPGRGIALLCELGLGEYSLPDVPRLRGTEQEPGYGRHKDVFSHTLQVLDRTPPRLALRWAALLHDVAKPATKRIEGGKVTFHGHDRKGERMARRIMNELHQPSELIERVGRLVGLHLRANAYEGLWTDSAVRRFVLEVGDDLVEDLLALSRADVTTGRVERRAAIARSVSELEARIRELRAQEDIARIASPLDGLDLMQLFERGPGPWIQPIKDHLKELVIEGELAAHDKEAAVPIARALYAEMGLRGSGGSGSSASR